MQVLVRTATHSELVVALTDKGKTMRINLPIRARALAAVAATAGIAAFFGTGAAAASSAQATVQQSLSENWAGYVATGKTFSSVAGAWTEPTVKANPSSAQSYSAAWVGLGGASGQSQALEQIGTSADYVNGRAEYYAWYELPPSTQVKLNIAIHPGDKISANVGVSGTTVKVSLSDQTTGRSVVKTLQMSNPDRSSAEWIVEAPAAETIGGNYRILSLADFGKVAFTKATATAAGHVGAISDSHWSATRVQLSTQSGFGAFSRPGFGLARSRAALPQPSAGATTSTLSGETFSVSWQVAGTAQTANGGQPAVTGYPGPSSSFSAGSGYGRAHMPHYPWL
jgi:hypothetical protein